MSKFHSGKKAQKQRQQALEQLAEQLVFGSEATSPVSTDQTLVTQPPAEQSQFSSTSAVTPATITEEPLLAEVISEAANAAAENIVLEESTPTKAQSAPSTPPPDANPSLYWKRITRNWFSQDTGVNPWRFEYREGRGYVAVANQTFIFAEHHEVCSEQPLIWTKGHPRPSFNAKQVTEMQKKVSAMNEEDRSTFYFLPNVYSEQEYPKEVGIFITCSFDDYDCDDVAGTARSMIYSAISSLKHSCAPNVLQTFYPDDMSMSLYPLRDISEGEELTISYIGVCQVRTKRREELMKRYRFQCCCLACEYNPDFAYPPIKNATYLKNVDVSPDKNGVVNSAVTFEASVKWCDIYRQSANDCDKIVSRCIDRDDPAKAMKFMTTFMEGLDERINKLWCIPSLPDIYLAKASIHTALMMMGMMTRDRALKAAAGQHRDDMVELTDDARQISQNITGSKSPQTRRMCQMVEANWDFEAMRF